MTDITQTRSETEERDADLTSRMAAAEAGMSELVELTSRLLDRLGSMPGTVDEVRHEAPGDRRRRRLRAGRRWQQSS